MSRIDVAVLDRVRDATDLVALVGETVSLKREGGRYVGLCPFHEERSPSFGVTPGRCWKCFGCGEGGDAIGFVSRTRGLGFRDAVAWLAARAGIVVDLEAPAEVHRTPPRRPPDPREPDYPPAGEVARFWAACGRLDAVRADHPARVWLRDWRGVDDAVLAELDAVRLLPPDPGHWPAWVPSGRRPDAFAEVHQVVVPVFDACGALRSVRFRAVDRVREGDGWRVVNVDARKKSMAPAGHAVSGLVLACPHARAMLAGVPHPEWDGRVVVAEGEPDAWTWMTLRARAGASYAVVGVLSGAWTSAHAARIPTDAKVLVRTHHDPAGDRFAEGILATLAGHPRARRAAAPGRADPTEGAPQKLDDNDRLRGQGPSLPADPFLDGIAAPGGGGPITTTAEAAGEDAPPGDTPLDVLAAARTRLEAAPGDRRVLGEVTQDLLAPSFVLGVARSPDRRAAMVALAALAEVRGSASAIRKVEAAVERACRRDEAAAEAQAKRDDAQQHRALARQAQARREAAALREAWPPERPGPYPPVDGRLDRNRFGDPKPCFSNALKVVRDDPRWGARLRLNLLGNLVELDGRPPRDELLLVAEVTEWIGDHYGLQFGPETVRSALLAVASSNAYHPVRDYLEALPPWDGTPRISLLLTRALGIRERPLADREGYGEFALWSTYLRRTLIGAVARAMAPGCKLDTALILVGEQGKRKSSFFEVLFGKAWFGDSPITLGDKEAPIKMLAVWAYELAELETMNRHTAEQVKQFLTIKQDQFRHLYEKSARFWPRHSVLVGSTNKQEFLTDPTGSRRFWPIPIPDGVEIDLAFVRSVRDLLWAEALAAYQKAAPYVARGDTPPADARWWLERDEDEVRARASETFEVTDVWDDRVVAWLREQRRLQAEYTTMEILEKALSMSPDKAEEHHRRRLGAILRRLGYTQKRRRIPGYRGYDSVWVEAAPRPSRGADPLPAYIPMDAEGVPC